MKKIKINYNKEWGKDGVVYSQTVKIPKQYQKDINEVIKTYEHKAMNHTYERLYFGYVTEELNFTKLTVSKYVRLALEQLGFDTKRYLDRNTIIQFI